MALYPDQSDSAAPLVSILIPNHNHGQYLPQCFDSVLNQTYPNIEVCFSDNGSTDESWSVAKEYESRHPDVFSVGRSRSEFTLDETIESSAASARGKYVMTLRPCDALLPNFIKRCVELMESHRDVAFVLAHRSILGEDGMSIAEPAFFANSGLVPTGALAMHYLTTSVNQSVSQIVYRSSMTQGKRAVNPVSARYFGARIMDFNICCCHPVIYLKEPQVLHREHADRDGETADRDMLDVLGQYALIHQFAEALVPFGYSDIAELKESSVRQTALMALSRCVEAISRGDEAKALKYFHVSAALYPKASSAKLYQQIDEFWSACATDRTALLSDLIALSRTKTASHPLPTGSIQIA